MVTDVGMSVQKRETITPIGILLHGGTLLFLLTMHLNVRGTFKKVLIHNLEEYVKSITQQERRSLGHIGTTKMNVKDMEVSKFFNC